MEALSAGEASLFAVQTAPTLSVAAFGNMITKSYVTTFCGGLQAAEACIGTIQVQALIVGLVSLAILIVFPKVTEKFHRH